MQMKNMPTLYDNGELANNRKMKLLEVAAKIFAQKGYRETTTKEIGKMGGVSAGILYYYFGSKSNILRLIIHQAEYKLYESTVEYIQNHRDKDPITNMKNAIHYIGLTSAKNQVLSAVMINEIRNTTASDRKRSAEQMLQRVNTIEELIIDGIKANVFKVNDSKHMAFVISYLLGMWARRYRVLKRYYKLDQHIDKLSETILKMLGVKFL